MAAANRIRKENEPSTALQIKDGQTDIQTDKTKDISVA